MNRIQVGQSHAWWTR